MDVSNCESSMFYCFCPLNTRDTMKSREVLPPRQHQDYTVSEENEATRTLGYTLHTAKQ